MFFKTLGNEPCDNFYVYGNYLTTEERELVISIASENLEVCHSTKFGTLIEIFTPNDGSRGSEGLYDRLVASMIGSNDAVWEYDIHLISNIYILNTKLSFDDKHSPLAELNYQSWYYGVSNIIKIVGMLELDGGVVNLNNGEVLPLDEENSFYTFSSTTLCRVERNKKYLICFCLGKNFK